MRAIEKLSGGHSNIVAVLQHGQLNGKRYYFDMELCFINLDDYFAEDMKYILGPQQYFDVKPAEGKLGCLSMWGVFKHLVSGLRFIHSLGELHRDIKPRNGVHSFNTWANPFI